MSSRELFANVVCHHMTTHSAGRRLLRFKVYAHRSVRQLHHTARSGSFMTLSIAMSGVTFTGFTVSDQIVCQ